MSTPLEISLFVPVRYRVSAFASLMNRLLERAQFASVWGWDTTGKLVELDLNATQLTDAVALESRLSHDWKVSALVQYKAVNQRPIEIKCSLLGPTYGHGIPMALEAPIQIRCGLRDFLPSAAPHFDSGAVSMNDLVDSDDVAAMEVLAESQRAGSIEEAALAYGAIEEFFLRCVGVRAEMDAAEEIYAGAMHEESSVWPAPDRCFMVYHPDLLGFVRDIARIYLDYWKGTRLIRTFEAFPFADLSQVQGEPEDEPIREVYRRMWAKEPIPPAQARHFAFLDGLEAEAVERLVQVTADDVYESLAAVQEATLTDVLLADSGGAVLADVPNGPGLWHAYEVLYRTLVAKLA